MTKAEAIAKYHAMEQRIIDLEAEVEALQSECQQLVSDDNSLRRRAKSFALRTTHRVRSLRVRSPFTSV